ncbi:SRPBCC family protein [Catenovulum sp. SM1970]|uniref:SRPBCC family protein n=1 Tax=Marinifaba aquimaris TaxID=2741323 RepID=UPI001573BD9A|nr:SRPBCC family protein [Marinifaba aquimaris]NTS78335.1 SRPBCC family protein [Marinifaba aquimaris]
MTIIKYLSYLVSGAVLFFVAFGLYLPDDYKVERQIKINAPADEIHIYVGNLDRWHKWTIWQDLEPDMQINVLKSEGVGAEQRWSSKSGTGSLTFTRTDDFYGVDYDLVFDSSTTAKAGIHYSLADQATIVSWQMSGQVTTPVIGPYVAMMMDGMLGPTFEKSLINLKELVE